MLKEYRKIATIKAEQYDGSQEMADKYNLEVFEVMGMTEADINGNEICYIKTTEGRMKLIKGDWIATGINGKHWPIKPDVFAKTYVETGVEI